MHHLIWTPDDAGGSDIEKLEAVGLGRDAVGAVALDCPDGLGPDGTEGGTLFVWGRGGDIPPMVRADWSSAVERDGYAASRYHVGIVAGHPPKAAELIRESPVGGEGVDFGPAGWWTVPTTEGLCNVLHLQDGGTWGVSVPPHAASAWQRITTLSAMLRAEVLPEWGEVADAVLSALQLNYRLPAELVGRLQLFTNGPNGTLARAMHTLIADAAKG